MAGSNEEEYQPQPATSGKLEQDCHPAQRIILVDKSQTTNVTPER
jgi:hypothetical protein